MTDFFDDNKYSHDPRTQFMGWAVMFNGAWDYPADVRGYTWGWVHELHLKNWSFRYASAAMPRVANGLAFDRRMFVNRGDVVEVRVSLDVEETRRRDPRADLTRIMPTPGTYADGDPARDSRRRGPRCGRRRAATGRSSTVSG